MYAQMHIAQIEFVFHLFTLATRDNSIQLII